MNDCIKTIRKYSTADKGEIGELVAAAHQCADELEKRDELLKKIGHDVDCNSRLRATSGKYVNDTWVDDEMPCDCWIKEMKELLGEQE